VMNDALWIGRRRPRTDGPTIVQARCQPAALWGNSQGIAAVEAEVHRRIAALAGCPSVEDAEVKALAAAGESLEVLQRAQTSQVLAQVLPAKGSAIQSVTVDLSPLGQAASTRLFDDGQHGDGQAGDGLWGVQAALKPQATPAVARRAGLSGHIGALTVTATDAADRADSRTAVLAVHTRLAPRQLVPNGEEAYEFREIASGPASARGFSSGRQGKTEALRLEATGPGPWQAGWRLGTGVPLTGYQWLQLDIRGTANQDVSLHVVDHYRPSKDFNVDVPHLSAGVRLLAGGYLQAVTGQYQTVRVPIARFLPPGTLFVRRYSIGLALSAKAGGVPCQYDLTNVRLVP